MISSHLYNFSYVSLFCIYLILLEEQRLKGNHRNQKIPGILLHQNNRLDYFGGQSHHLTAAGEGFMWTCEERRRWHMGSHGVNVPG
jgi:hypothetical protein